MTSSLQESNSQIFLYTRVDIRQTYLIFKYKREAKNNCKIIVEWNNRMHQFTFIPLVWLTTIQSSHDKVSYMW